MGTTWATLERELARRIPAVGTLRCAGESHRLRFDGSVLVAADHDESAERVLRALGAAPRPPCREAVRAWSRLEIGLPWELAGPDPFASPLRSPDLVARQREQLDALSGLDEGLRGVLVAAAAVRWFAEASPVVKDRVAPVVRDVLIARFDPSAPAAVGRVRAASDLPPWWLGAVDWTDDELATLRWWTNRLGRLDGIPDEGDDARDVVFRRCVAELPAVGVLSSSQVDERLRTVHWKPAVLRSVLAEAGWLVAAGEDGWTLSARGTPSGAPRPAGG